MRRLLAPLAALAAGCAHSIDLFVPAAEVSPRNDVIAAISAGKVQELDPGASVRHDGVVMVEGRAVARVAPTDTLVVAAGAGDDVGSLHVRRTGDANALITGGIVVLVGGNAAAWIAGGACAGRASDGDGGLFDFSGLATATCWRGALLGSVAAFVLGLPMLLAGVNGPLCVKGAPSVALDARGIRISF